METLLKVWNVMDDEAGELRLKRQRLHNLRRPAVDLPTELLSRIFELSCPAARITPTYPYKYVDYGRALWKTRNAITLTCSTWNQIARGTPQLWTYIRVDLEFGGRLHPPAHMISRELERAAGHPLFLYVTGDSDLAPLQASIQRCASNHESRLNGTAEMGVDESGQALGTPTFTITNITRLHISGAAKYESVINLINSCSHNLESLCWRGGRDGRDVSSKGKRPHALLPLNKLRGLYFEGAGTRLHHLREIVAPNVERLGIYVDKNRGSGIMGKRLPAPSKFTKLRQLDLHFDDHEDDEVLIAYIRSNPDLEEVRLGRRLNDTFTQGFGEATTGFRLSKLQSLQVSFQQPSDVPKFEEVLRLRSERRPMEPFELVAVIMNHDAFSQRGCLNPLLEKYNVGVVFRHIGNLYPSKDMYFEPYLHLP